MLANCLQRPKYYIHTTHIHEVFLHVVREVLQDSHLTDELFRSLCSSENRALAKLCIVMDSSAEQKKRKVSHNSKLNGGNIKLTVQFVSQPLTFYLEGGSCGHHCWREHPQCGLTADSQIHTCWSSPPISWPTGRRQSLVLWEYGQSLAYFLDNPAAPLQQCQPHFPLYYLQDLGGN